MYRFDIPFETFFQSMFRSTVYVTFTCIHRIWTWHILACTGAAVQTRPLRFRHASSEVWDPKLDGVKPSQHSKIWDRYLPKKWSRATVFPHLLISKSFLTSGHCVSSGRMTFASRNVHLAILFPIGVSNRLADPALQSAPGAAEVCPCDGWKFKACRSRWGHLQQREKWITWVLKSRKVGSNKEEVVEHDTWTVLMFFYNKSWKFDQLLYVKTFSKFRGLVTIWLLQGSERSKFAFQTGCGMLAGSDKEAPRRRNEKYKVNHGRKTGW